MHPHLTGSWLWSTQVIALALLASARTFFGGNNVCIDSARDLLEYQLVVPGGVELEDLLLRAEALHQRGQVYPVLGARWELRGAAAQRDVQLPDRLHRLPVRRRRRRRRGHLPRDVLVRLLLQVRDRWHHVVVPVEVASAAAGAARGGGRGHVGAHPRHGAAGAALAVSAVEAPAPGDSTAGARPAGTGAAPLPAVIAAGALDWCAALAGHVVVEVIDPINVHGVHRSDGGLQGGAGHECRAREWGGRSGRGLSLTGGA
mmetsp:Transcript_43861/g.124166  ORF Transcript_43861/g.124166 Transcript_43861/m.124166 type:complete len:259 (-) Transcript_43861:7-783(-)